MYAGTSVPEAYLRIPVCFKKDESGWKLSECDYLKFILRGVTPEKREDYNRFSVNKMPEGYLNGSSPQTGDANGALIAIAFTSFFCLPACVIVRSKAKAVSRFPTCRTGFFRVFFFSFPHLSSGGLDRVSLLRYNY